MHSFVFTLDKSFVFCHFLFFSLYCTLLTCLKRALRKFIYVIHKIKKKKNHLRASTLGAAEFFKQQVLTLKALVVFGV